MAQAAENMRKHGSRDPQDIQDFLVISGATVKKKTTYMIRQEYKNLEEV